MNEYVIFTDSGSDIKPEVLDAWDVRHCDLTFRFTDDAKEYSNYEMPTGDFYERMRKGGVAKTAAVNAESFAEAFERELAEGRDIVYVGFSTGLSSTYNAGRIAAETLKDKYPERSVYTIDSLCASAGEGLLVKLACDKRDAGATAEECAAYVESVKMNVCHWFTVEDLVYLKRGGRISAATALVGNALGIKPVMHVDDEGHLVSFSKARGRVRALRALADKYGESALEGTPIFISQADCFEDAETLAGMIKESYGGEVELITDVGPVIGSHSGPGTMALFFLGKER